MFAVVWGARFWEAKARQASQEIQRLLKASISHAEIIPRELEPAPRLMTGLDGEPSPDTPWTHSRRGATHRSRRRKAQLILQAIPVSSHARTVPGPASLGSDSTATSVPMADGSNSEERHHGFRWTTTNFLHAISDATVSPCSDNSSHLEPPLPCQAVHQL